jgi:adenosylmethionine-8-amino-7-oxononanoate aminotransferase
MTKQDFSQGHIFYRRMAHTHPEIVRGEGVYLFDRERKAYLDGSGGAIVVNAGHGIDSISQAISDQADQAAYLHPTMFTAEVIEKYADALAEIVPLENAKFYFLTSGSEAVEAAIKLARQIQVERGNTTRYLTISRWMSYHGLSLGALAVSGKPKMRKLYQPMFQDVPHIPPPYCYRCPFQLEHPACGLKCADALEEEILNQNPDNVAAFLAEPVSGATLGAVVPPDGYWPRIREICDRYGVLLIMDEVMTGMGRTGTWFAAEHWRVVPDILTIGKGAASGYFPLSVLVTGGEFVDLIASGSGDFSHGGTYSHHAVGAAAGLATLAYLQEHHLVESVAEKGHFLADQLKAQLGSSPYIGDIRGIGLMWGIEFVRDRASQQPFDQAFHLSQRITDEAFRLGLVVYPGSGSVDGHRGDHIMVGPPFCITQDEIIRMVALLKQAIDTSIHAVV